MVAFHQTRISIEKLQKLSANYATKCHAAGAPLRSRFLPTNTHMNKAELRAFCGAAHASKADAALQK
jgi:hypothetical protein